MPPPLHTHFLSFLERWLGSCKPVFAPTECPSLVPRAHTAPHSGLTPALGIPMPSSGLPDTCTGIYITPTIHIGILLQRKLSDKAKRLPCLASVTIKLRLNMLIAYVGALYVFFLFLLNIWTYIFLASCIERYSSFLVICCWYCFLFFKCFNIYFLYMCRSGCATSAYMELRTVGGSQLFPPYEFYGALPCQVSLSATF